MALFYRPCGKENTSASGKKTWSGRSTANSYTGSLYADRLLKKLQRPGELPLSGLCVGSLLIGHALLQQRNDHVGIVRLVEAGEIIIAGEVLVDSRVELRIAGEGFLQVLPRQADR